MGRHIMAYFLSTLKNFIRFNSYELVLSERMEYYDRSSNGNLTNDKFSLKYFVFIIVIQVQILSIFFIEYLK
jgi:hypothetical protein